MTLALLVGPAIAAVAPPEPDAPCAEQASYYAAQVRPNPRLRPELWWVFDAPCPEGAHLAGASPPAGRDLWCEDRKGRRHGRRTTFAPNHLVDAESDWWRDREVGPRREWDPARDVLVRETTFDRRGALHGEAVEWTPEGGVTVTTWVHGLQEGATWRLDARGALLLVERWRQGERDGRSCAWRDGALQVDQRFEGGTPARPEALSAE